MLQTSSSAALYGTVNFRSGEATLYRTPCGRLWPTVIDYPSTEGLVQIAVDGYIAVGDTLLLGDNEADQRHLIEGVVKNEPLEFLRSVQNGNFTIAIHDQRNRRTRLISSWGGFLPLYIYSDRDRLIFSEDLATLRRLAGEALITDEVGLAELYWLGYQIGDRTALNGVSYMPPGAIVDVDWVTGRRTTQTWDRGKSPAEPAPGKSTDDLVAAFLDVLRQACRRLRRAERRYGIKLSGGMDSRLLLACWGKESLTAYTFGAARSHEAAIARDLAKSLDIPFEQQVLEGDFFSAFQRPLLDRYGIAEYFHYSLVPAFRRTGCDLTLDGLLGDVFFGGLTLKRKSGLRSKLADAFGIAPPPAPIPQSNDEKAEYIFDQVAVSDGRFRVLHPDNHAKLDASRDAVKNDIAIYLRSLPQGLSFTELYTNFILENRSRRYISLQGASCRPAVESLYPFIDKDVRRFAANLGSSVVAGKRFYMKVYRTIAREINDTPSVNSLMPVSWPESLQVLGRLARFGIETAGYRMALLSGGRIDLGRINCNQWPRWIAFDRPLRAAAREFMAQSDLLEPAQYDAALHPSTRDHGIRGTRLMLTLSYCGLAGQQSAERALPLDAAARSSSGRAPKLSPTFN